MRTIQQFAVELHERVKSNFDSIVIVDSGAVKGTGKSTFSIQLQMECCKLISYVYTFDLIIFNPTDEKILEMVKTLPRGVAILIDEGSKVAYKRDYAKDYQKNLIKFINICRKFGKILIINNPDFWDLDKDLRNLADFRVTIIKRGMAQVKGKSPNPDLKDKWLRDVCIEKIEDYTKGDITKLEKTRQGVRKTPNFLYDIPVPEMDKALYSEYEELSKREEIKSFQEDEVRKIALEKILIYLLCQKLEDNKSETARAINQLYIEIAPVERLGDNLVAIDKVMRSCDWIELRRVSH
jgi:hypothetical protein